MADTKITALTALTAADPANDVIPIVDVSDTTMAASGTTKKISVNNILGASGTATLASATITGDLTVDTTTLKVDSTNNRVGVGTATPTETLEVKGTANFYNTSGTYVGFMHNVTQVGYIGTANAFVSGGATTNFGLLAQSALVLASGALAIERLKVEAAGDITISTGNVVMATPGKGIDFTATASGSGTMTSELLNDYEEGTFTPTLATDDINFTSVGYTTQSAKYTKIGNLVTIAGTIQTSSVVKGTANGSVVITGLPFTQPSTDARGGVNCFAASSWLADAPLSGDISGTRIFLLKRATSVSASANLAVADVSTGAANNIVRFSGQYYV